MYALKESLTQNKIYIDILILIYIIFESIQINLFRTILGEHKIVQEAKVRLLRKESDAEVTDFNSKRKLSKVIRS